MILFSDLSTHDKEQLCDGQKLSLKKFIDWALGQAPHLPPVRKEGKAGEQEADDVDKEEEDDQEIEIQKLRCFGEWHIRIIFIGQPAAVFSNLRQNAGLRITLTKRK